RMRLLPVFWHAMAPGNVRGPITMSSMRYSLGVLKKEVEWWTSMSYWELAKVALRVTVIQKLVSKAPKILILTTLWIQSWVTLTAGKGSKTRLGGVPDTTNTRSSHSILLSLERYHKRLGSVVSALLGYPLLVVAVITNGLARVVRIH